jgi:hypothetical protein
VAWENLELPALRWIHATRPEDTGGVSTGEMGLGSDNPAEALPELTESQFHEALRRLKQHGLIEGQWGETSDMIYWLHLRITANGLRVLGEWPPAEGAAVNDVLAAALRHLAPELSEEDATAARRAGSALTKISAGAVYDVLKDQAQRLGEDALG